MGATGKLPASYYAHHQSPVMHTAPASGHAQRQPGVMYSSPPVMQRNSLPSCMVSAFGYACHQVFAMQALPVARLWKVPASVSQPQVILRASLQLCHGPASVHGVMHQPLVMQ